MNKEIVLEWLLSFNGYQKLDLFLNRTVYLSSGFNVKRLELDLNHTSITYTIAYNDMGSAVPITKDLEIIVLTNSYDSSSGKIIVYYDPYALKNSTPYNYNTQYVSPVDVVTKSDLETMKWDLKGELARAVEELKPKQIQTKGNDNKKLPIEKSNINLIPKRRITLDQFN